MFSSSCTLPSPTSAGSCPPLFGRFTGNTAQSDFSSTCMSVVRLWAFTDRPSHDAKGALEISRFSSMLFSLRARALRLRRTGQLLACNAATVLPSSYSPGSRHPDPRFFEAQSPGPPMPRSTLRHTPRDVPRKTRGQDGFAISFPAGTCTPTTCRFIPAHSLSPPTRKLYLPQSRRRRRGVFRRPVASRRRASVASSL